MKNNINKCLQLFTIFGYNHGYDISEERCCLHPDCVIATSTSRGYKGHSDPLLRARHLILLMDLTRVVDVISVGYIANAMWCDRKLITLHPVGVK